jgi:transcriptional regulator, ArsR family
MLQKKYEIQVGKLKALSDTNRLMIIDMLSCGELCACEILERFEITQPTLSHHMKILCECGLVLSRKEGKNSFYRLNDKEIENFSSFLKLIFSDTDVCICQ